MKMLSRNDPGEMRMHGFVSKPEIQKLNRNSIYIFVNGRLIRDRLIQHALTEAYRNIIPPTVFPVVLLFLEMPPAEVDVNVHPSKTEVRFRQQSVDARFRARHRARRADEGPSGAAVRHRDSRPRHRQPGADAGRIGVGSCRLPASGSATAARSSATGRIRVSQLHRCNAAGCPRAFSSKAASQSKRNAADPRGSRTGYPSTRMHARLPHVDARSTVPDNGCAPALDVREEEPTLRSGHA